MSDWHEMRFTERKGAVHCICEMCGRDMWFPKSKIGKYKTCGGVCAEKFACRRAVQRIRQCETCGNLFAPRERQLAVGHGRFCSQKCNKATHAAMNSEDAKRRAHTSFMAAIANGSYKPKKGEENPKWKGGPKAYRERMQAIGRFAEYTRAYRKKNPEKVKEFTLRRTSRKYGRLPKGTIASIGNYQKWTCVVCRCGIKEHYHVDHITPLAKGGVHAAYNIQLLCPTCNVRKSAKDPLEFMQSRGFLL